MSVSIKTEHDLLPCLYCGSKAILWGEDYHIHYVECTAEGCGAEGPMKADINVAVEAWNRVSSICNRPPDSG